MERTTSDASATALGDSLNCAPWLSRLRVTSRLRSLMTKRCPALIRLAAIGPPIPPVPIKPKVFMFASEASAFALSHSSNLLQSQSPPSIQDLDLGSRSARLTANAEKLP